MKQIHSPTDVGAPDASDAHSDKKQRTPNSDAPETLPEEIFPQSTNSDSADQETTISVTDEDSCSSESEYLSADEEEEKPELDPEELSYLCNRCLKIDFDDVFSRRPMERGGDPILWFYSGHKVLDDPRCAFCQAMQFIHPSLDTLPEWKKRIAPLVVGTIQNKSRWESGWDVTEDRICLTFGYHREPPANRRNDIHRWTKRKVELRNSGPDDHLPTHELVGYLAEKPTIELDKNALPAAAIKPWVNFGMIKRRLKECREEHEKCRNKRGEFIKRVPGMRLIDCKTRTVVPAPEGASYAALSYVWGTPENEPIGRDCSEKLPDRLPNTISDAMLVTRKLKLRYLWIDRYCIRQGVRTKEEMDEKHGQIVRMHNIYKRSSITLIAAAGDGPHYGLPGARTKQRRPPPIVRLPHRTLFATLPDPKLLVDVSKWSSRGWTFQEGLLARRRLVFTDQQVYFQCGQTGDAEAWEECGEENMAEYFDVNQNTPLYPYFALGEGGVPSVWPRIDQYVNLTLGNREDVLNAILGILTHYEELNSIRHIAGLPMSPRSSPPQWCEELADALSWECDRPGERFPSFPSWSWTGWTCKGLERNVRVNRLPAHRIRAWSISVDVDLDTLLKGGNDLSQIKYLRVTAPCLEATMISMDGISEDCYYWIENYMWDADGFDNNEKRLGVRYLGVEEVYFINLTDSSLLKIPLPSGAIRCSAIIMDEDRLDIPDDQLGKDGDPTPTSISRDHATALLVVEKENGFEKVGVSGIDRWALRRVGSVVREFRLI